MLPEDLSTLSPEELEEILLDALFPRPEPLSFQEAMAITEIEMFNEQKMREYLASLPPGTKLRLVPPVPITNDELDRLLEE